MHPSMSQPTINPENTPQMSQNIEMHNAKSDVPLKSNDSLSELNSSVQAISSLPEKPPDPPESTSTSEPISGISDDEPIGDQVATVDNGLSPVSMATSEEGELDGTSDDEFEIEQSSDDDEQSDHEPEPGTYDQEEIDKEIAELLQELDSKYPEG